MYLSLFGVSPTPHGAHFGKSVGRPRGTPIQAPQPLLAAKAEVLSLIEVEVFRLLAETVCPRCLSGNIDDKFGYMGEYSCRHCGKFWKTT